MRVKTFDATGVAPGGRLYAGDLNAIQDQYADLVNYSQTHGVGTLAVGESGLQLLRYGSLEARLTGAFRVDGIVRGLGGVIAGTFTTAQRDAIPLGSRPYGLVILNITTNQLEWNSGSDAVPNWIPGASMIASTAFPTGTAMPFFGAPSGLTGLVVPMPGFLLLNGAAFVDATYPALATFIGGAYGIPAAGQTNLPDAREKALYGMGLNAPFTVRGSSGGEVNHVLTVPEMAPHAHPHDAHNHLQNSHFHSHSHGLRNASNGDLLREHAEQFADGNRTNPVRTGGVGTTIISDTDNTPSTAINQAAVSTEQNVGGGTGHNNMPPHLVIGGWMIKT